MKKDTTLKHIAIICDGNRRWAKQQGMAAAFGHRQASNQAFEPLVKRCAELGVQYITFWVFSTENWKRGSAEFTALMEIFREGFRNNLDRFIEMGVKIATIGDVSKFPEDIQEAIRQAKQKTAHCTTITVVFAMNYGGRSELVRAIHSIVAENPQGVESITEAAISAHLDTANMPDPDLIIRTGGEQRLSGFMLWQSEYAELYFSPVLYPDFTVVELDKAIEEYNSRQRRFGGN